MTIFGTRLKSRKQPHACFNSSIVLHARKDGSRPAKMASSGIVAGSVSKAIALAVTATSVASDTSALAVSTDDSSAVVGGDSGISARLLLTIGCRYFVTGLYILLKIREASIFDTWLEPTSLWIQSIW